MNNQTQNNDSFLSQRYEFKYVMNPELAERVESYIAGLGLSLDSNSTDGPYIVNSLYLETPFLDDFQDKEASLLIRKKMRIRIYEKMWNTSLKRVWLEIKNKRNFHIYKERTGLPGEGVSRFLHANDVFALLDSESRGVVDNQSVLKKFAYICAKDRYQPHVVVQYLRTAYLDTFASKVRVTFDKNLVCGFAEESLLGHTASVPVVYNDTINTVIMEVKFNGTLPWWFRTMIDVFDLHRVDFSKYNHSVTMLRNLHGIPVSK